MTTSVGLYIGSATSVAVCRTRNAVNPDDPDNVGDSLFTTPTALRLSADGGARLIDAADAGFGGSTVRDFVRHVEAGVPVQLTDGNHYYPADLVAAAAFCLVGTVADLYETPEQPTCVVVHPTSWSTQTVADVRVALVNVGLEHADLVPDDVAVGAWCASAHTGPSAVVDVGVDLTRVSLVSTAAVGDTRLEVDNPTGRTFTETLATHVLGRAGDRHLSLDDVRSDPGFEEFMAGCEAAKITLSYADTVTVKVHLEAVDAEVEVTSTQFTSLVSRAAGAVPALVDDCLLAHGLDRSAISSVVLIGAAAQAPALSAAFGSSVIVEPHAAARGAAIIAAEREVSEARTEVFPVIADAGLAQAYTGAVASLSPAPQPLPSQQAPVSSGPSRRLVMAAAAVLAFLVVGTAAAFALRQPTATPTAPIPVTGIAPPVTTTEPPPARTTTPTTTATTTRRTTTAPTTTTTEPEPAPAPAPAPPPAPVPAQPPVATSQQPPTTTAATTTTTTSASPTTTTTTTAATTTSTTAAPLP